MTEDTYFRTVIGLRRLMLLSNADEVSIRMDNNQDLCISFRYHKEHRTTQTEKYITVQMLTQGRSLTDLFDGCANKAKEEQRDETFHP